MTHWTLKQVLAIGKQFLKEHNVRYKFIKVVKEDRAWGWADDETICVYYGKKSKPVEVASVIMHEYYHVWCYRNNKYPIYHITMSKTKRRSLQLIEGFLRTALKAERFVDGLAKKNFKSVYRGLRYVVSYQNQHDVDALIVCQLEPARRLREDFLKRKKSA